MGGKFVGSWAFIVGEATVSRPMAIAQRTMVRRDVIEFFEFMIQFGGVFAKRVEEN